MDHLAEPITLEVKSSVSEAEAGTLHALYERVARRGDVHFEVFDKEYFLKLGERMPDQTRYFIWRQAGKVVAFSFCTVHGDTLYDNDLGLDETVRRGIAAPLPCDFPRPRALGARARVEAVLQFALQLRSETAPAHGTRAARSLRAASFARGQRPGALVRAPGRADAPGTAAAAIPERG